MIKRILAFLVPLALIAAACQSGPAPTGTPRAGRTRTRVAADVTQNAPEATATLAATSDTAGSQELTSTPPATQDLQSYILTQAYSQYTPIASLTPQPQTTGVVVSPAAGSQSSLHITSSIPLDTPTPHFDAPASVIVSGPVAIANAINTATCIINGVGDCTSTIPQGSAVYFTWNFGVQGSQAFSWGNAAVVVQKDGQPYKWFQANNTAKPAPADGQMSTLAVGDQAVFRGGIDNIQPGTYSAKLVMCLASVEECNAGTGWQDVGGDTVQFVVNP